MGRGQQWIFPAGDITPHGIDRNIFMAEDHAGARFNFEIPQALFLRAGKIRHLLLGKFNILNILAA